MKSPDEPPCDHDADGDNDVLDQSPACDELPDVNANTAPVDSEPPAADALLDAAEAAGSPGSGTLSADTRFDTGLFTDPNGVCT
ncbi:hypothetical protein ACFPIJ_64350 [Dactylosporangium cerinum]|uniref:Uncharacterized protein n=1 Tax=Dactylosporangium cerinum TaxID=1434730 RepID=A0ABV9WKD1_9ACTN